MERAEARRIVVSEVMKEKITGIPGERSPWFLRFPGATVLR